MKGGPVLNGTISPVRLFFGLTVHASYRFKLRLRPEGLQAKGERLPKIWIDKSVVQIFADYLAYIYKCAKAYISDTHSVGRQILESGSGVEFVLSHPNGWGGTQQSRMRRAAVSAGLVPDIAAGAARIHFITEGEASLHFCIASGLAGENIQVRLPLIPALCPPY